MFDDIKSMRRDIVIVLIDFGAGEIIRVETLPVPQVKGQLDSTITRWSENSIDDKLYVFSLRVYSTRTEGRMTSAYNGLRPVFIGQ
jgi:hypothetical protein